MNYLYIRAWGKLLGSFQYYIDLQVEGAQADGAPETAIFKQGDGTWATFDSIEREDTRREIQAMVSNMTSEERR